MQDLTSMGPETALRTVLTAVLLVWAAWWCVGLVVALVDRRLAARLAPPLLRALLATGAVVAVQAPSHAAVGGVDALRGLSLPERPLTAAPAPAPTHEPVADAHVVAPGESLWSIVREHSPDAGEADVGDQVRAWYRTNRAVLGPDPDLIHPGQRLDPPGAR
ncbi:LysM peptidoglycan-binding domain-containing protein [Aeromicrobium sp. MLTX1]